MKLIRCIAGYGPWAVAAALGLDVSYPVQAAPPVARPPAPISAVRAVSTDDTDAATNVQVAWLADPGLFLCTLSARPTGKGIELTGYVSNEPSHLKAVAIARSLCSCPVIDNLKIHAGVPIPMTRGAAPAELAPVVSSVMVEALGDKVLGLQITCPSAGRVEITGSVPTLEDKLQVSKCLRMLAGCTHVINRTSAPGSPAGAAIVANIPLMMTARVRDDNVDWKAIPDTDNGVPGQSSIARSAPPLRSVVTPARATVTKSDGKSAVVASSMSSPPFTPVYDAKPGDSTQRVEAVKAPEPVWTATTNPNAQAVITDIKPVEPKPVEVTKPAEVSKPVELTKAAANIVLPEIRTGNMDRTKPTTDKSQLLTLMPEAPKVPAMMPPVEGQSLTYTAPEPFKPSEPKRVVADIPEPPKPIIVFPIMQPAKSSNPLPSPYGGVRAPIPAPPIQSTIVDLPKPADLPQPIEMPMPVVEVPGKAAVTDLPKEVSTKSDEAPNCDLPEMVETVRPVPAKPIESAKVELPLPVAVEPMKPTTSKVERFAQAKPTVVKPVTYSPEPSGLKPAKEPISIILDAETARRAVEDVCRGAGSEMKVTAGPGRQLTIGMKVATQGEWERLYTKVKALPEINGYQVAYNAQVEGSLVKPTAPTAPAPEVTVNKPSVAPMMGVLRSNAGSNTPSAEAAKTAIEKLCQGKADDVSVRTPAGKQVAVSLKVVSASDWEVIYAQIKALPEIAGCSVIYNISVK